MNTKIKSFTDLHAWREGHTLVLTIYKITKKFPRDEIYVLVSQMRRAALSITSNIAEAFSRKTRKDKRQFYAIALGSLTELQNQLVVARDLKYTNTEKFHEIGQQSIVVSKLITGLMKSAEDHL